MCQLALDVTGAADALRSPGVTVMRGWLAASRGNLAAARETLRPVLQGAEQARRYWPLWPCWNGLLLQVDTAIDDNAFAASCLDVAETNAAHDPGVASFEGVALNLRGLAPYSTPAYFFWQFLIRAAVRTAAEHGGLDAFDDLARVNWFSGTADGVARHVAVPMRQEANAALGAVYRGRRRDSTMRDRFAGLVTRLARGRGLDLPGLSSRTLPSN